MIVCYVIVNGNPVDGLTITGPFPRATDAVDHASTFLEADWWVAPVHAPYAPEKE